MARFLSIIPWIVTSACTNTTPEAKLANNDRVQFVRAQRGHEIVVKKGDLTARVRLVGVYAFDTSVRRKDEISSFADMAVAAWEKRFSGKEVEITLERAETDSRGRFLGYLHHGTEDIGEAMLKEGLLAVYTEYPFQREAPYRAAETEARQAVRGVWTSDLTVDRLKALRGTWAAAHARKFGGKPDDPLLAPEASP